VAGGVHDLYDDGQVLGQVLDGGRPHHAGVPEAHASLEDGRSGEALLTEEVEKLTVERAAVDHLGFPEEDPHEHLLAVDPTHESRARSAIHTLAPGAGGLQGPTEVYPARARW